MWIDWQTIITAGAVVSALGVLIGLIVKGHNLILEIRKQKDRIADLEKHHDDDVHRINEENCLICFALSACLDGLIQLGANHSVPEVKEKLDKFINKQAHI